MTPTLAVPFVPRRDDQTIALRTAERTRSEIRTTAERVDGLLLFDGARARVQWRRTREVSVVGERIATDRGPARELAGELALAAADRQLAMAEGRPRLER